MSCPDWSGLTAWRRQRSDVEPPGWGEALAHRVDCPRCRREALRADPTLLFGGLAPSEVAPGDVEVVRQGVTALRRARSLERGRRPLAGRLAGWSGRPRRWLQTAAAAALIAAALTAGLGGWPEGSQPATEELAGAAAVWSPEFVAEVGQLPVVEEVDRPNARVYQLRQDDLAVIMVVDESLDV